MRQPKAVPKAKSQDAVEAPPKKSEQAFPSPAPTTAPSPY